MMAKVEVGGINLYYDIHGTGEPLLFIHGLGSSTRDWEAQTKFFSADYRVILIDLRGHGQSDKPKEQYSILQFSADIEALLNGLEIESLHVVGLSLGGVIALQFALDHPHRVRSLVLVNSFVELLFRTFSEKMEMWKRNTVVRLLGMRKMGKVLAGRLFPKDSQEELRNVFIERWAENNKQSYLSAFKSMAGWSVRDRLGELHVPTLVLSAEHDYTPLNVKEAYVSQMLGAELVVIEDSYHGLPAEKPEEFNHAVAGFLNRLDR
ncbi:MAG: alpha/beta hydrolase [Candidatus Marinimicrobia bacterium]|jgi:pimeloyl-ACP methyl ester carboxylesterase|nr:alpha/beta hydrolase [Candidatus Neomarinimicrobiota bacterium]MDP6593816.1 alpha/beta hydrolase [Candidatus Neomarinimicrobiota bacterium]MDP6966018.1 alpha/beta hydrolase [Candidatus Neomarinimicrobiota bacterium]|tara:strand:- start:13088 stop:13879 length:792 start_codon:yes stop_codon:yes gene_type:complete